MISQRFFEYIQKTAMEIHSGFFATLCLTQSYALTKILITKV